MIGASSSRQRAPYRCRGTAPAAGFKNNPQVGPAGSASLTGTGLGKVPEPVDLPNRPIFVRILPGGRRGEGALELPLCRA
eukprot:scaffold577_cov405-Prasinococcus_capsulatus_cf.AAC.21